MRRLAATLGFAVLWLAVATPALAHVTIQPTEASTGEFFRFTVRVPTERDDAATTKVEVQFPETVFFVSFQPVEGWRRTVQMKTLEVPVEIFGEPQDRVVGSVSWEATGPGIAPQEFQEFGFSALVPEEAGELVFPSIQTYDSGEVVRWIGPPDADQPAPIVEVIDLGLEEGQGELALLAQLNQRLGQGAPEEGMEGTADEEDGSSSFPLVLSWIALAVALAALAAGFLLRRRAPA
jgi:MYXO-CTERM domain-containing protein